MTKSEILDAIYKRAGELGIDLEAMGIYDDEDLEIRALTAFFNNLEDIDDDMVSWNPSEESDEIFDDELG